MARRRVPPAAVPASTGRAFTLAEVDRIRDLIATHDPSGLDDPNVAELYRMHEAAGRRRGFMLWELDPVTDLERAVAEELAGGLQPVEGRKV